ncbi:MAG TPA: hypothetical protein VH518_23370 [Tepidisphaeraceae bacterium]|jgi:hypothetical protein
MAHGAVDGDVGQLSLLIHASQHQPTAAHVPAADEIGGEEQSFAEHLQERLDILARRHAAEKDELAIWAGPEQLGGIPLERHSVGVIRLVDVIAAHLAKVGDGHRGSCRNKPAISRDDIALRLSIRRIPEPMRVRHLPTEVEAAEKGEDVAEGRPSALTDAPRQIEGRGIIE